MQAGEWEWEWRVEGGGGEGGRRRSGIRSRGREVAAEGGVQR